MKQKNIREEEYLNSVNLVICPLIGLIEDQIKEGQPLGLTCASLQDVNDLFTDNLLPSCVFVLLCCVFLHLIAFLDFLVTFYTF